MNPYDETPYPSSPYPLSSPRHLITIGKMFGMLPASLENAKILELGCSTGGNIIPTACFYPGSQCVAIDLSCVEINMAKEQASLMKLNNIDIRHMSIMDVSKKSLGEFDYIIAHGILSWVPNHVRSKIFDIAGEMLSDNGIAYISYNALPGWNMVRSIREMMLYHASFFDNIRDKEDQAIRFLEFVKNSMEYAESPYAKVLEQEFEILKRQSHSYIVHEHLEENNIQYCFYEFIAEASKRGLQYLGDARLSTMLLANRPKIVVDTLSSINDIVRTEQYMDFITNRRFRSTLLCRSNIKLNRNLKLDELAPYYISFNLFPEKPLDKININDEKEKLKFQFSSEKKALSIITNSTPLKTLFYTWIENSNYPMTIDEVTSLVASKYPGVNKDLLGQEIINSLIPMIFSEHLNNKVFISSEKPNYVNRLSKCPKTDELIRFQSVHSKEMFVTNRNHEIVPISHMDKYILRYLDGLNSQKQVLEKIFEHFYNGDIISQNNEKITNKIEMYAEVEKLYYNRLHDYIALALLIG